MVFPEAVGAGQGVHRALAIARPHFEEEPSLVIIVGESERPMNFKMNKSWFLSYGLAFLIITIRFFNTSISTMGHNSFKTLTMK